MKPDNEPMPGSVFKVQQKPDMDQVHTILDQFDEEAITMAAEEVKNW